jgi:S1-C subfamily serine protease
MPLLTRVIPAVLYSTLKGSHRHQYGDSCRCHGIGFAIPIDQAKQLQATLESGQKAAHPYIGVQMVNLTPDLAWANNQNPNSSMIVPEVSGILVVKVLPNTPPKKPVSVAGM